MNINERAAGSTDILLLCLDFGPRFCPCELCKGIVFSYIGPILDQHIRFQNFNRTIFLFLQHYLHPCVAQDQLVFNWSGACTYALMSSLHLVQMRNLHTFPTCGRKAFTLNGKNKVAPTYLTTPIHLVSSGKRLPPVCFDQYPFSLSSQPTLFRKWRSFCLHSGVHSASIGAVLAAVRQ